MENEALEMIGLVLRAREVARGRRRREFIVVLKMEDREGMSFGVENFELSKEQLEHKLCDGRQVRSITELLIATH